MSYSEEAVGHIIEEQPIAAVEAAPVAQEGLSDLERGQQVVEAVSGFFARKRAIAGTKIGGLMQRMGDHARGLGQAVSAEWDNAKQTAGTMKNEVVETSRGNIEAGVQAAAAAKEFGANARDYVGERVMSGVAKAGEFARNDLSRTMNDMHTVAERAPGIALETIGKGHRAAERTGMVAVEAGKRIDDIGNRTTESIVGASNKLVNGFRSLPGRAKAAIEARQNAKLQVTRDALEAQYQAVPDESHFQQIQASEQAALEAKMTELRSQAHEQRQQIGKQLEAVHAEQARRRQSQQPA
ncbi:MAG: hypothetical protein WCO52_03760 [bacterium]